MSFNTTCCGCIISNPTSYHGSISFRFTVSRKDNISKGVRQEFDDIDYWHKLDNKKPVFQLKDGTWLTEYEYLKKFMHEGFANNFDRHDDNVNILQTEEHKKWAIRNNNNTNRDTLNVIRKSGKWATLFQIEDKEYLGGGSELWEKDFTDKTYAETFSKLMQVSADEVGLGFNHGDIKNILRMYFRIKKFLRMVRKDKKNNVKRCKQCKQLKPNVEYNVDKRTKDSLMKKCKQCVVTK